MSDSSFAEFRERLEGALEEIARVGEARGADTLRRRAEELAKNLAEQRFVVAVVGEFKRGKSTLIDALLGQALLPVGVLPLTSVVTAVTYGQEPRAEIRFANGRTEEIPPEELHRYVTERGNPGNHLGVERATLWFPAPDLDDGVMVVDTPGVGSIHDHNTEATRSFLAEVDAAIFVTSVDPPISQAERAFLHEVRDEAAHMFFVVNKIDRLSGAELDETLAFTRDVLAEAIGHDVDLFPLSARDALEAKLDGDDAALVASGLPAFEDAFRAFLVHDKGRTILLSAIRTGEKLITAERNALRVEEEAARLPVEELTRRAADLDELAATVTRSRRDLEALLAMEIGALVAEVEEDLARFKVEETDRLLTSANELIAAHPDPRGAAEELEATVQEELRAAIEAWRVDEEQKVAAAFRQVTERFVTQANDLVARTTTLCAELMNVDLTAVAGPESLAAESEFTYAFFNPPAPIEATIEHVRRHLPAPLARKMLLRNVAEEIPILVDKHCGRLRWDLAQRLERSRIALTRDLTGRLDETFENLRRGLDHARARKAATDEEARAAAAELAEARDRLDRAATVFEEVARSLGAGPDRDGAEGSTVPT